MRRGKDVKVERKLVGGPWSGSYLKIAPATGTLVFHVERFGTEYHGYYNGDGEWVEVLGVQYAV